MEGDCFRGEIVGMDREVFRDNLIYASEWCREFTTQFVLDLLPDQYRFWVDLNCSFDQNLIDGEVVFPDDVDKHGSRVGPLTVDAVVSLLWRDEMVPEWIDISAWDVDPQFTYFKLKCCGRFTAGSERLYYRWTDCPPFGIKSPIYPGRLGISIGRGEPIDKFTLAESRQEAKRIADL